MTILIQPDTSTDITRAGLAIGQVKCINVNPPSQPAAIRWFGMNANGSASGQARTTQAQAAQDVADWADGKEVPYEQHAVVPKAGRPARVAPLCHRLPSAAANPNPTFYKPPDVKHAHAHLAHSSAHQGF
ncbi:MAG: hypothetical protein ACRYFV_15885 [Janthinobacterium lividum]